MIHKENLKAGLIAGIGGLVVSMVINYFILPKPETVFANAFGNGISGLMGGFMGGFFGFKKTNNKKRKKLGKINKVMHEKIM